MVALKVKMRDNYRWLRGINDESRRLCQILRLLSSSVLAWERGRRGRGVAADESWMVVWNPKLPRTLEVQPGKLQGGSGLQGKHGLAWPSRKIHVHEVQRRSDWPKLSTSVATLVRWSTRSFRASSGLQACVPITSPRGCLAIGVRCCCHRPRGLFEKDILAYLRQRAMPTTTP